MVLVRFFVVSLALIAGSGSSFTMLFRLGPKALTGVDAIATNVGMIADTIFRKEVLPNGDLNFLAAPSGNGN